MSHQVIEVHHLSKRYRIGAREKGNKSFREAIVESLGTPLRNLAKLRRLTTFRDGDEEDTIWALKDVSFQVEEGEVLGIIGKNGSGKSTLLKILSRITEPTSGSADIHGRVSSLLEVGTGFHPELTGRENIFLNGAVLGMRKQEIERKFDEIVAFSEVEKFIDTPVKRYSSGMYVRLAFAVAAHLEPEILLVDEVLAVGDIAFQKKCLGKMEDVAKGGRTIVFISHNMGAIRSLCGSVIWLDDGQIVKGGSTDKIVREYEEQQLRVFDESASIVERNTDDASGKSFYISRAEMLNEKGERSNVFRYDEKMVLLIDFAGEPAGGHFSPEFRIHNELDQLIATGASGPFHGKYFDKKVNRIKIEISPLILTSGKYRISLSVMTGLSATTSSGRADTWGNAIGFTIVKCQPFLMAYEMPTHIEGACVLQHSFCESE